MHRSVLFIHGMFLNPKIWEDWIRFFEKKGYRCNAPAWPCHEGEPADLRAHIPPGLGKLSLEEVTREIASAARAELTPPILIGHSMGGLIVQRLLSQGLGAAGVCISSVAPNDMLSFDWGLLKNSTPIMNPLKGDSPYEMTPEGFHKYFCNTMPKVESDSAFQGYVVHESRNVMRDSLGKAGQVDTEKPHPPLLFIGGEKDAIIPPELNKKNAEAYTDRRSLCEFHEVPGRGHFICGQNDWEEVAKFIADWLPTKALRPSLSAASR
jgi:pimeloyl-ACP methyl ester carboxylesterase